MSYLITAPASTSTEYLNVSSMLNYLYNIRFKIKNKRTGNMTVFNFSFDPSTDRPRETRDAAEVWHEPSKEQNAFKFAFELIHRKGLIDCDCR